jgi:hypothetical protein
MLAASHQTKAMRAAFPYRAEAEEGGAPTSSKSDPTALHIV